MSHKAFIINTVATLDSSCSVPCPRYRYCQVAATIKTYLPRLHLNKKNLRVLMAYIYIMQNILCGRSITHDHVIKHTHKEAPSLFVFDTICHGAFAR